MQEYKQLIRNLVNRTIIKDRSIERDDLYQVALLAAHTASESFDPEAGRSKRNWILLCVRHALWRVARDARRRPTDRLDTEPEDTGMSVSDTIAIKRAIERLDGRDRSIVLMALAGHDQADIGRTFGFSRERARQIVDKIAERIAA